MVRLGSCQAPASIPWSWQAGRQGKPRAHLSRCHPPAWLLSHSPFSCLLSSVKRMESDGLPASQARVSPAPADCHSSSLGPALSREQARLVPISLTDGCRLGPPLPQAQTLLGTPLLIPTAQGRGVPPPLEPPHCCPVRPTLVSAVSDLRVLFMISSSRCGRERLSHSSWDPGQCQRCSRPSLGLPGGPRTSLHCISRMSPWPPARDPCAAAQAAPALLDTCPLPFLCLTAVHHTTLVSQGSVPVPHPGPEVSGPACAPYNTRSRLHFPPSSSPAAPAPPSGSASPAPAAVSRPPPGPVPRLLPSAGVRD